MKFDVFQGKKTTTIILPDNWDVTEVPLSLNKTLENPEDELLKLLNAPEDSPPLKDILKPGDQIAICVTDISRPSPDKIVLPPLLNEIEKAGIDKKNVTIIIGTGSHRDVTVTEMNMRYGYHITDNYRIINHNSRDKNYLTDLGSTTTGAPIVLNSILTMVDHIFNVGVMDLHQYAGYSGGAKTIAVGCAGEETIQFTHSTPFLEKSGTIPGKIIGNTFQQTLWEIVEPLPFDFSINVILDESNRIVDMGVGKPRSVFFSMVERAKKIFEFESEKQFEIAYLGVPHPKDINLYQASRALTYQTLLESPALKKGALVNLLCTCPEGMGQGMGEKRFVERMMRHSDPEKVINAMRGNPNLPGEQRAFMLARAMMDYRLNVVGSDIPPAELTSMGFTQEALLPQHMMGEKVSAVVLRDGMKKVLKFSGDMSVKSYRIWEEEALSEIEDQSEFDFDDETQFDIDDESQFDIDESEFDIDFS